jgi:glycosyltransferase involved in cell wall biosynthesis
VTMSLDRVTGGGSVERTFQMSRSLVKAGEECSILTTNIGMTPERIKELDGVTIVALPCLSQRFFVPKFRYKAIEDLVRNADIIHLMNHWTFLNALVYFIARRHKKPYVVCPAGVLLIYGRSRVIKMLYNWLVGRRLIRNATKHIAITADEISQFRTYGVQKESITIIPNGIDPEEFKDDRIDDFRAKHGLGRVPFILFVGRLNLVKGPDLLLKAFCNVREHLAPYHLVFAGPDEDMSTDLREIVAHFNVGDRVHFLGYVGGLDKSRAYHAADLLVIPSRREAMSIVVLEAGISGTPVLMTDQCGFNEIAETGGGMVVPASVEGLESGLLEMLGNRSDLKMRGRNLKEFVSRHFLWDSIIDKYVQLYKSLLGTSVDPLSPVAMDDYPLARK